MKTINRILIVGFLLFSSMTSLLGQEVMKLSKDQPVGEGSLEQISWLEGYWEGNGFSGSCDEIWMPTMDNSKSGVFRYSQKTHCNLKNI